MCEGTLQIDPSFPKEEENFVIREEFFAAITHSAFEETLEMPYIVARVNKKYWKQH